MSEGNHSSHPETAFFLKSVPQQKGGGRKLYYVKPYSPFVDQQVCVWFTIKIVADLISLLSSKFQKVFPASQLSGVKL